ncbi:DUF3137 domain-containing protein [Cohnella sp. GCM10027633]|uniref:DUF3137 domain-containing protein n=1 Tax=unclassified Cohnella TaxID=2636738 RepID=UPI0036459341
MSDIEALAQQLTSSREWDEVERKRWKYQVLRAVLWLPGLLVAGIGAWFLEGVAVPEKDLFANIVVAVIGLLFVGLGAWLLTSAHRFVSRRYSRVCKQLLVPELAAKLPKRSEAKFRFSYEATGELNDREIATIPMFDRYKGGIVNGEDALTVELADRTIRYEEVSLRRHGENSWWYTSYSWMDWFLFGLIDFMGWKFKGSVLRIEWNEPLSVGTTIFHTRWSPARRCIRAKGRRLTVRSPEFRRAFKIRSTEPEAAKLLLTERCTDSFLALRKLFPRRFMSVCMNDNTISIAIRGFDLFEVKGLRKPDPLTVQRIYAELDMILDAATGLVPPERAAR